MHQPSNELSSDDKLHNADEELAEIQNKIQHIERKIRLAVTKEAEFIDSEKKVDVEASKLEIKKNDLEIKQLMMQVKELEVKIKRSQKSDENVIAKELQERSRDLGNFKGKSAKEAIHLADADVLELDKKCKASGHDVQLLKLAFRESEKQLKDIEIKCRQDFGNDPTEFDCLQRIRELENEQQRVNRDIIENEVAQSRYKMMKEQLQKNQMSYPVLLLNVGKEYETQQVDVSSLEISGDENPEIISSRDIEVQSKIGDGDFDMNYSEKIAHGNKKSISFNIKTADEPDNSIASEQQIELRNIQEIFDRIKEVTHASDIQDAERRFLVQKSIHEDLFDLKQRLFKSLHELRTEKKHLDSRMVLMNGTNSGESKNDMIDELNETKRRHEEQEKRRNDAKVEHEKLTSLLIEIESRELKLLQVLKKHFPEVDALKEELTASQTIKKFEEILKNKLKDNN